MTPDQINALKVAATSSAVLSLYTLIRTVATYGLSPELLLLMPFAASRKLDRPRLRPGALVGEPVGRGKRTDPLRVVWQPGVLPLLFFDALFAGATRRCCRRRGTTSFYLTDSRPRSGLGQRDPRRRRSRCGVFGCKPDESRRRRQRAKKALTALLKPPPVRAALGGLAVAASPLRDALVGPNARLETVFAALTRFSGAYLPSASLVLAGSLIAGGGGDDDDAPPGLRRIVALCLHRFCLLPALGAGALFGLASLCLVPAPRASPLFGFSSAHQFAMPPAEHGRHVPAPRRPQGREAPGPHTARRLRGGRRAAAFVHLPDGAGFVDGCRIFAPRAGRQ